MLHPSAAMLPSSSLRSLLCLSRRLNPRLPSPPLLTHLRLLSSSSSPSDGAGWATYDSLSDSLAPSAGISSASVSASDPENPADSGVWGVYDPVAGRIVVQGQPHPPPPPSPNSDGEGRNGEESVGEKEAVKERGKGTSSGGKFQASWSAVAAARKARGKAAKEKVSYVCDHCGEGFSQWWGVCRHCQAMGTLIKFVAEPDATAAEGSHHAVRSWIPQKSKEMMPQSLQEVTRGVNQAEWRITL